MGLSSFPGFACAAIIAVAAALPASAEECVRLVPGPGGETLVNQCNVCRIVTVHRSRVGNATPTQRSFNVHPGIPVDIPFKGSGRSQKMSEAPCEGAPDAPVNIVNPQAQAPTQPNLQCVRLYRVGDQVMMLNACDDCRRITVARVGAGGGEARMNYDLKGKGRVPLEALGAATARVVGEGRCAS